MVSKAECYSRCTGDLLGGLSKRQPDPGMLQVRGGRDDGAQPRVEQKNGNSFP